MLKNSFILAALVFVVFFPCLQASFINYDDTTHLLNNPALQHFSVHQVFTQTINNTYIPLTVFSFAVEKFFVGFNPFVFHLDNLLLYIAIVILVLYLGLRLGLTENAAFLAALIFAVHPMRVEDVAWVTERKDVLYGLFYLLALHQYWSYLKTSSIRNYGLTILFGFLSILAKPMALSLPLILWTMDWFSGRRFDKKVLAEKIPILIYIVATASISYGLNMRQPLTHPLQGMLIWVWSLCFYLWKFFWPLQVGAYYPLPHPVSILYWPYGLSVLFLGGLVYLLVRFRHHRWLLCAFFYFFFSIFFLMRFDENDSSIVSDRFMFLPSLGICFLLGLLIDRRIKNRLGHILVYILLGLMSIETNAQCRVWHDSISFWDAVIKQYPNNDRAYNNRGLVEPDDLALKDFSRAIALNPQAAKAYNNRGLINYFDGHDRQALDDFNHAIKINPFLEEAYKNRAMLLKQHGEDNPV